MFSYILTGMRVLWKHARSIWIARVLSAMLAALMAPLSLYLLQLAVDEIILRSGQIRLAVDIANLYYSVPDGQCIQRHIGGILERLSEKKAGT